jgi:hypothetical protein
MNTTKTATHWLATLAMAVGLGTAIVTASAVATADTGTDTTNSGPTSTAGTTTGPVSGGATTARAAKVEAIAFKQKVERDET